MLVRPAVVDDAAEVVRLARLMFESMGSDASDPGWQVTGARHVRERLGRDLAVLVADDPEQSGRLVSAGAGTVVNRLPTPRAPSGRAGYVQWVYTETPWRRRGLARGIMEALLRWYEAEGVTVVELHATPDGETLYRLLGFDEGDGSKSLRWRAWARSIDRIEEDVAGQRLP